MMQPIRVIANASSEWLDDLRIAILEYVGERADADDPSMDDLLRHTMQSDGDSKADARGVWERLCGRVVGPFGRLAVEGPAGCGDSSVIALTGVAPFIPNPTPKGVNPSAPGSSYSRGPGQPPESVALLR
jgi:hypothetical protein